MTKTKSRRVNTLRSPVALSVVAGSEIGFQAAKFGPVNPDPNGPRPIEAVDTLFIEDLTWMEVRDAMKAGKDTVIGATGGIEQNGPYLIAGKHNIVLRATKINGIDLAPVEKTLEWDKTIISYRAEAAVKAIRAARKI